MCSSIQKRGQSGLGEWYRHGKEASLPLSCSYFFNPSNNQKIQQPQMWLQLSQTRCLGFTFAHPKSPSKPQHILDNSLTLVKFSSKIWSLLPVIEFPSPSADICLTLLLKVTLCHLLHYWVGVKLLCLKEATFLLYSWSMLQGCPLPILESLAFPPTSSTTCRSSSKCLLVHPIGIFYKKLLKWFLTSYDRHQEGISQQSSSYCSLISEGCWSSSHKPNLPK